MYNYTYIYIYTHTFDCDNAIIVMPTSGILNPGTAWIFF